MSTYMATEVDDRLADLDGWERVECEGHVGIQKRYRTITFMKGLAFVTRVGELAEKANHHPDVTLTYPSVTLFLMTHDAGGVTDKDFALAKAIDEL